MKKEASWNTDGSKSGRRHERKREEEMKESRATEDFELEKRRQRPSKNRRTGRRTLSTRKEITWDAHEKPCLSNRDREWMNGWGKRTRGKRTHLSLSSFRSVFDPFPPSASCEDVKKNTCIVRHSLYSFLSLSLSLFSFSPLNHSRLYEAILGNIPPSSSSCLSIKCILQETRTVRKLPWRKERWRKRNVSLFSFIVSLQFVFWT